MTSVALERPRRFVKPTASAPELSVISVGGGRWRLDESAPKRFTVIFFCRGLHCPVCHAQLGELEGKLGEFERRGVEVIVISGDTAERARQGQKDWCLERLTVGCEMPMDTMRDWGLFISDAVNDDEPEYFNEPSVFMVRPDGNVFFEVINSAPFARPSINGLLAGWLPSRYYLPAAGVRTELLVRSSTTSRCANKGSASYGHVCLCDRLIEDLVWSYPDPQHDGKLVRDLFCFFSERVDLELDGVLSERPSTRIVERGRQSGLVR